MKNEENLTPAIRFAGFTEPWEKRKLGELVDWKKGTSLSKDKLNEAGIGNPVIHYADLYKFGPVINNTIHWSETDEGNVIPKNSLLFPMSDVTPTGLARTSTISKENVRAGSDLLICVASEPNDSKFLSHQINYKRNHILPLVTGTTVRHISASSLDNLVVFTTSLDEQSKVISIFNKLENVITVNQCLGLIISSGNIYKKFRCYVPSFSSWEKRKLGSAINSELKGRAKAEMSGTKSEYLNTDRLNGEEAKYVDAESDVDFDDVLILWDGSQAGTVYHGFSGALGSTLKAYKPMGNGMFLYQYLKRYQQIIYDKYRTPNIPHVNKDFTTEFFIVIPVLGEQEKVGKFFDELDNLITVNQ